MKFRDLLAFFNLTGHIWVLQMHKKGKAGGNFLYKCDSLNDLLSCVTAFNPKALKPREGWKVTLTNTKEKEDYSSMLDMKELYPVTHETKYIIEKTYGINFVNEQYPIRMRYLWNKPSCETFINKRRGKVIHMGRPAPEEKCYPLMDAYKAVYGYSPGEEYVDSLMQDYD